MKVVVAHAADESVDPPKGRRRSPKTDVQEIAQVLRGAGHEVSGIAIDGTAECLRALTQQKADLVFNLVESFGDDNTKEPHVAAYYDLLGLRYTGSGPRGLTLAMDKAVAKKILAFHNVVSPKFAVFWQGRLDRDADDIEFPVIVKPLREDGSIGIGFDALAGNIKELMERIDALTVEFNSPVLIEQYIEGREIYVGVLGNAPPEVLPPVELDLSHLPKGTPRIAGTEVKWNEGSRAYRGSKIRLPKLPKAVATAGAAIDEGKLTAKIKGKMILDDLVKARAIDVTTAGTTVTLSGSVISRQEHDRAVQLARETEGVTQVVDRLVIQ